MGHSCGERMLGHVSYAGWLHARGRPTVVHIQHLVAEHLRGLCQQFTQYFSNETIQDEWIRNPFKFKPAESDALSMQDKEALIDLTSNHELEQMITHSSIGHFWLSVQNDFLNSHKEHWVNFSIRFNVFVRIGIFCYDIHQEQISFTSSSGGWPSSVSDVTTTTNKSSLCSEETNAYRSLRQEYNYVSILINNKDIYILALFKFLPTLCYRSSDFFDWGGQFLLFCHWKRHWVSCVKREAHCLRLWKPLIYYIKNVGA